MTTPSVTTINRVRITTSTGRSVTLESTDDTALRLVVQSHNEDDLYISRFAVPPSYLSLDLIIPGRLDRGRSTGAAEEMAARVAALTADCEEFRVEAAGEDAAGQTMTVTVPRLIRAVEGADMLEQEIETVAVRCFNARMVPAVNGERYRIAMAS